MSQNPLVIGDASGAAVLATINAAFDSLASNNSGAGSPATTYPYMWWPDTANGVLKQRNAANTGWLVRAALAETLVVARAANTALAAGDFGRSIIASGTWTQTFAAAATLGDGWYVDFRNNGTGVITLDPNASETIDGVTTIQLAPGENCFILCNGTAFFTIGRTASDIQRQIATAFTSAGTAPVFTLTPVPAITAYAANQRFRCKFHAAGTTGSNTLNVSGLGAKSLKQYDATGAKVAAVVATSQLADVEYDGVDFVIVDPLPPAQWTSGGSLASAATVTIGSAVGDYLTITGTTTITGFGTAPAGTERTVLFAGALKLVQSASLLLNNNGNNIDTAPGDVARVRSDGGGVWRFVGYTRADGSALSGQRMVLTAAVSTTSGTAIDFTGIPSWAKRITLQFNGVSLSGSSHFLVQLGTSSGVVAAGYSSSSANNSTSLSSVAGFIVRGGSAALVFRGHLTVALHGTADYVSSHAVGRDDGWAMSGGGAISLGGVIDRIRLTTVNGTDTFDAGSVSLLIEG